jgi:hypothetical protein
MKTPSDMRAEVTQHYTVDAHGLICDLGKFERDMLYVPFYWEASLNGCSSADFGTVQFFEICTDERAAFPELGDAYGIGLAETEQGFVIAKLYDTAEEYSAAIERCERAEEDAQ